MLKYLEYRDKHDGYQFPRKQPRIFGFIVVVSQLFLRYYFFLHFF